MPQMFDWIFFVIIIPPPLFLLWDLLRDRGTPGKQTKGTGARTLSPVGVPAETTAQRDANIGTAR